MLCRDLHLTLMFSGLYKEICLREREVWRKLFQTKLLSRLSHKVCRLLSSPVLLHKFTVIIIIIVVVVVIITCHDVDAPA